MTSREKKFTLIGLALGVALAAVLYFAMGSFRHPALSSQPAAAAPTTSPAPAVGQPEHAHAGHTAAAGASSGDVGNVELTEAEQKTIGLETVAVKRKELVRNILAPGRVEEPETQISTISARIGGRLDKLYVSYTGQSVRRGQPIALIYSPEVLSSAQEYKLALENRKRLDKAAPETMEQADELVNASRRRLELWGITGEQIAQIAASSQPQVHITLYSPVSGIVTERKVTEGQYVREGDVLYTLTDLGTVWVKADVYESDVPLVRTGAPVEITSEALPGSKLRGRVAFLEPMLNPQTRTLPVRVQVPNPGLRLRPGMFANVTFHAAARRSSLVVPRSAVLDTGLRKVVYVAQGSGMFEGRAVELGPPADEYYPVLSGLKEGECVVAQGAFMLDSQTRLTTGMTGLFGGSKEFANGSRQPPGGAAPAAEELKFTFRTDPSPPKGAAENAVHVTVLDPQGKPVSDAQVRVAFAMPAMPGMGEMRAAADLAWNGSEYAGKISIPMAGPYNVSVEASRGGQLLGRYRSRVSAQ